MIINRDDLIGEFYTASPPSNAVGLAVRVIGAGGGASVQYDENSTVPFIVGTAILWEDALNVVRVPSAVHPLPISGTVTLGAGSAIAGRIIISDGVDDALVSAAGRLQVELPAGGGGLTNTELRATPVPISGSVTLGAAADVSDRVGRLLGHVTVDNASLAVTGAFFQATQPVSSTQLPAALVGARLDVNLGASGITLPVSLAAAVDVSDRAVRLLGVVYGSQGQQLKQTATNFNLQSELAVAGVLIDPRSIRALTVADIVGLGAGSAQIGLVKVSDGVDTALVTTSGFLQVMEAKDAARVNISIKFNSAAAPAADTICSCVKNTDGVDAAGATTFAVTAGKRFRVTGIKCSVRTTTAATPWGELTVRMNPSGAAVIGSPLVHRLTVGGTAAVIGNVAADYYFFPDGWELSGTQQIALTFANNVATNVTDIVLFGFEYTP